MSLKTRNEKIFDELKIGDSFYYYDKKRCIRVSGFYKIREYKTFSKDKCEFVKYNAFRISAGNYLSKLSCDYTLKDLNTHLILCIL